MPDPTPPQNHTIVGEDGELLQPDTSVNPDAYADYLATHVHRDPLMFRIRENVRENGCVYSILVPISLLVACSLICSMFIDLEHWIGYLFAFVGYAVGLILFISIVKKILNIDTRR